jgi:hypothetical protein
MNDKLKFYKIINFINLHNYFKLIKKKNFYLKKKLFLVL